MEYNFRFQMQSDEIRRRILDYVKPTKDSFTTQNLNLVYGVYDEKSRLFLTMTYYMSAAIMRDGRDVDESRFIALYPHCSFTVYYEHKLFSEGLGSVCVPMLNTAHLNAVKAAVTCYEEERDKFREFEDNFEKSNPGKSLYRMKREEIEKLKL